MHPYRTAPTTESIHAEEAGYKLAFGVLAFFSAVQVATALPHGGPFAAQTLFGVACLVAGLTGPAHRPRVRAGDNQRRPR